MLTSIRCFIHVTTIVGFMAMLSGASQASGDFECQELQKKNIIQGKDGWFFRENDDLREHFSIPDETAGQLAILRQHLKKRGSELILLSIPPRGLIAHSHLEEKFHSYEVKKAKKSFDQYIKTLNNMGLHAPNIRRALRSYRDAEDIYFFKRDSHWTPAGANITAKIIAESLYTIPDFHKLPKHPYITRRVKNRLMNGNLTQEVKGLCNLAPPGEPYPYYNTTQESVDGSKTNALTDSSKAKAVLVGSTFSASDEFHFAGLLSWHTGLDITNYTIADGTLYSSLIHYVSSPEYQNHPAPYIIWETSDYDSFQDDTTSIFRQITPAIQGVCSKKDAIAIYTNTLDDTQDPITLFNIAPGSGISGSQYYIWLHSDDPNFNRFTATFTYDDESQETVTIHQQSGKHHHGNFFVSLSAMKQASLISLQMNERPAHATTINARLCKSSK